MRFLGHQTRLAGRGRQDRCRYGRVVRTALSRHRAKVQHVAAQVRGNLAGRGATGPDDATGRITFDKGGTKHLVPHRRERPTGVRLSTDLDEVLGIDTERKLATVESGVRFDELLRQTLRCGLMPMLVPELKGITVGGAISGCSVESLSHRYGGFHDTCTEYELVTGLGEIITCGPQNRPEIFAMIHGSFGTLGRLTSLTCRLIPAQPFVALTYRTYSTIGEYCEAVQAVCNDPATEFVDGIIHGPEQFVLCLGRLASAAPYTNRYDRHLPFYRSTSQRSEDYLTLDDYLFRYDRDCHWISRRFGLENPVLRRLAGRWLLGSDNMLKMADRLEPVIGHMRPDVTVDLFFGMSRFERFYHLYHQAIGYYPMWIVPYRLPKLYPWLNPHYLEGVDDDLFIDAAIYGLRQPRNTDHYATIDQLIARAQGVKTLISLNRYNRDEFWTIFNKPNYDRAKALLDPRDRFGNIYDKTLGNP